MYNNQIKSLERGRTKMERNICGGKLHSPINTESDILMMTLGLRSNHYEIDREVFKKSYGDKARLKKAKTKSSPKEIIIRSNHNQDRSRIGNLVVYVENTEKSNTFKTTYSFRGIKESEKDNIIFRLTRKGLKIKNAYFNR